ncbi:DoxX family protein [Cupriavidus sp. AcVe19-1a]|uniref:DoxX family protein n=1 Tax=Cupriavidus sp. AcVe19-1a TaxID=2821359 RepID=UPI001AE82816|nr:DoxX family protein [Cupriavidus sp. AcVe19-1a]MBP0630447.1 DoxX family protein [Cupriavidus sp. AcVe19-1a]
MSTPSLAKKRLDAAIAGRLVITLMRLVLGAWMINSGLSHWLTNFGFPPIFPQPLGTLPASNAMLVTLIETGVFDIVKACELIAGLLLLLDLFVPFALAMTLPISFMVFFNAIVLNLRFGMLLSTSMSVWCLYLNVILILAYLRYYLPMLACGTSPGGLEDFKRLPAAVFTSCSDEQRST